MKKALSFILVLLLAPQICFASHANDLEAVVDEYHFFLTVEWDQRDAALFETRTQEFESEINDLIENGLSFKELERVELKNLSRNDRELVINRLMKHAGYSKGASWNGEILGPAIILGITSIAIVAFIRYAVKKNRAFDQCVSQHGGDEQSCIDR